MSTEDLDLGAYLERIAWRGSLEPSLDTLRGLQLAHVSTIPFENLDIQLGREVRLDLASLQAKLVRGGRGGYCFEHNSLFASVLRSLDFQVVPREARVRRGTVERLPRTHLALQVTLADGGLWLSDVGFGGDGPLGPVPFLGMESLNFGERFRIVAEGAREVLQVERAGAWLDLYALEPSEVFPVDLEMANHYTSTHPASRFVQTLTAQISRPEGRWMLRNRTLMIRDAAGERTEEISAADLLPLLRDRFGLDLPSGTRFRALEAP